MQLMKMNERGGFSRPAWIRLAATLAGAAGTPAAVAALVLLLVSCGTAPAAVAASARLELYPELSQVALGRPAPAGEPAFARFFAAAVPGPIIPGLEEGAVPQGLAYLASPRLIVISAYFDGPTPSVIMAIDAVTGLLSKTVWLADVGGEAVHGHVGGLAAGPACLWVASDAGVYRYSLARYLAAPDGAVLTADSFRRTSLVASSATYADGMLWIGEFAYYGPGGRYRTDESHHLTTPDGEPHHALAGGYRVAPGSGALRGSDPDYLVSIPDRVQGLAFLGSRLALSLSYGRRNDSTLELHRNPLETKAPAGLSLRGGRKLPLWFVDHSNRIDRITAPPMTEGITPVGMSATEPLLVLFESGAQKYRATGRWPLDRLFRAALPGSR